MRREEGRSEEALVADTPTSHNGGSACVCACVCVRRSVSEYEEGGREE